MMWRAAGVLFWSVVCSIRLEQLVGADASLLLVVPLSALLGVLMTALSVLLWMSWQGLTCPAPEAVLSTREEALASVEAWHLHGLDPRRGRLFVTSRGLRFVPSAFSVDHRPLYLPASAITACVAPSGHRIRIQLGAHVAVFRLSHAPLVALWLMDVTRGDRSLGAALDIEGFTPESSSRSRLTAARPPAAARSAAP